MIMNFMSYVVFPIISQPAIVTKRPSTSLPTAKHVMSSPNVKHLSLHPNVEPTNLRVEPNVEAKPYPFSRTPDKFKIIPLQEHVQSTKFSSSKS